MTKFDLHNQLVLSGVHLSRPTLVEALESELSHDEKAVLRKAAEMGGHSASIGWKRGKSSRGQREMVAVEKLAKRGLLTIRNKSHSSDTYKHAMRPMVSTEISYSLTDQGKEVVSAMSKEKAVSEASGVSIAIPDLSKWQTKITGKGSTLRTIALQGKTVNVAERADPKGSGLYRYTLYVNGKKIGKQDFSGTKDLFYSIKAAVVEGAEETRDEFKEWADPKTLSDAELKKNYKIGKEREDALTGNPLKFYKAIQAEMLRRKLSMEEGRPYDAEDDPRRFSDKMLYDFMDMAAGIGGEERIKLSKPAYKKYSAAMREMKHRKLPMKRPPVADFDDQGTYMKGSLAGAGGVQPSEWLKKQHMGKKEGAETFAGSPPKPPMTEEMHRYRVMAGVDRLPPRRA